MGSSNGVKASDRPQSKVCDVEDCSAWKTGEIDFCHHHQGMAKSGSVENNDHAVTHGMHQSAETFFANADDHHLDTYYAYHECLCDRHERMNGWIDWGIQKDIAEIAFDMAKLDMAKEWQAKNAVDPELPLSEKEEKMTESGLFKKEVMSRVEQLKTNIRRENRLALKEMGIYASPEKQQANATEELASLWAEDLS